MKLPARIYKRPDPFEKEEDLVLIIIDFLDKVYTTTTILNHDL